MTYIAQPHPSDHGLSENAITGFTCDISVVNGNGAIVSRNSIFNYQLGGEFWGTTNSRIEDNSFFGGATLTQHLDFSDQGNIARDNVQLGTTT